MARLALPLLLLTAAFLSTSAFGDSDFHFGGEDMVMPGVRSLRGRHERAPVPDPDSPIFFPGGGVGGGGLPEEPVVPGPDENLEVPLSVDELDFSILNRINSISNISDFAKIFDLALPEPSPASPPGEGFPFEIGSRFGSSTDDAGETFEMANCKPELVTIPLDLPNEAGTMFFPTCIRLEQCGGCCYGPLLTCRPASTKVVKVKVLKVSSSTPSSNSSGGRRRGGGRRRRRRQSQQSYHTVEVIKHTACECGCRVREEDCHSALHTYKEGECACICKNKDEQAKCEQQNLTKYWDNETCSCFCRREQNCSTGEYFSQTTCSCERLTARNGIVHFEGEAGPTRRRRKPVRVPLT